MTLPHPHIDPDGLDEFSVVFTDRSLNHMSARFQTVMRETSALLREVYNAESVALIPGGGTYAMEAVARQFARARRVMVVRNGFFSYRWSQIFETGGFADTISVVMARAQTTAPQAPFAPPPLDELLTRIQTERPDVIFAPHVETASGIILPDAYIAAIGAAAREVGALFVLDGIASGCVWVDMVALNVDVLISAPQKGWSASPSAGIVLLGARALAAFDTTVSDSFALNLKTWAGIMAAYEAGGHAYHATMPTDAIVRLHAAILETRDLGFARAKALQIELGARVRTLLAERGVASVAAEGFGAPGVVVSYTDDPTVQSGAAFRTVGTQIAAGVPLQINEGPTFRSFRLGLFGLDKLKDIETTLTRLTRALDHVLPLPALTEPL